MNEIHRPQECINANCVNMCSIAQYEGFKRWFGDNPEKCPSYKKRGPINVIDDLEKIKEEIEDTGAYEQAVHGKTEFLKGITYCLNIIDKHLEEFKGEK